MLLIWSRSCLQESPRHRCTTDCMSGVLFPSLLSQPSCEGEWWMKPSDGLPAGPVRHVYFRFPASAGKGYHPRQKDGFIIWESDCSPRCSQYLIGARNPWSTVLSKNRPEYVHILVHEYITIQVFKVIMWSLSLCWSVYNKTVFMWQYFNVVLPWNERVYDAYALKWYELSFNLLICYSTKKNWSCYCNGHILIL